MPTDRLQARRPDVADMSADSIEGRRFAQSWRGYEPEEVKQFLAQVAAQVRSLRERLDSEAGARREAEQRASHPQIDEATLMTAVGEETAGILRTARSAAAEITAKAQAKAEGIVADAEEKAAQLMADAEAVLAAKTAEGESLLAERTAEAEATADQIRADATAEAEALLAGARQSADELAHEAAEKYQEMVQAAHTMREKILTDLARRRKLGSVQVEQLRAGRERLLDAYLMVRRTLDEVTDELQRADAEARAAADAVGRQAGEHGEELTELRGEEAWESLSVFPDLRPPPHQPTEAGPQVTAPKGVEPSPNGLHSTSSGLPPMVPTVLNPPNGSARSEAPAGLVNTGPATVSVVPAAPQAPAKVPGPVSGTALASAIISGHDAIESVRILPKEGGAREEAPSPGTGSRPGSPGKAKPTSKGPETSKGPGVQGTVDEAQGAHGAAAGTAEALGRHESDAGAAGAEMPAPGTEAGGAAGNGGVHSRDVDDLFARIRAGRVEATASARQALSDESTETSEPPDDEPESEGTGRAPAAEGENAEAESAAPAKTAQGTAEATGAAGGGGNATPSAGQAGAGANGEASKTGPTVPTAAEGETETPIEPEKAVLKRRDDITAHLESSLARKLKRALQDEQNSLLDRLRSLKVRPTPGNVLPSVEEHPDRFIEAGRPLLEEAASAGAKLAGELVGGSTTVAVKAHAVEDLAEELGKSIAEPLRQRLELAFRSDDEETSELADALGAAYREWKTQRIEAVARDQLAAAFSRGSYLAMGQGTVLTWVVSDAEGPCPDCEDNALAGQQPKGEPWPTGQLYPPAHPGCRCALLPVQPAAVGARRR